MRAHRGDRAALDTRGWSATDASCAPTLTNEGPRIARVAKRRLPPATQSIALDGEKVALRLGPDGLQQIVPLLAFP